MEQHTSQTESSQNDFQQHDAIQIPKTIADLPPEILEQIFIRIPVKERPVVTAVCRLWRNTFLEKSAFWWGMRLGRNANCYSTTSPPVDPADLFPLAHVKEIEFTPAIPAVMRISRSRE